MKSRFSRALGWFLFPSGFVKLAGEALHATNQIGRRHSSLCHVHHEASPLPNLILEFAVQNQVDQEVRHTHPN